MIDWFPGIETKLYDIHWDGVLSRDEASFLARQVANFRVRLENDGKPVPVWEADRVIGIDEPEELRLLRKELNKCQAEVGRLQTKLNKTEKAREKLESSLSETTFQKQNLEHCWQDVTAKIDRRDEGVHDKCEETIELLQENLESVEASLAGWKDSCVWARTERDMLEKTVTSLNAQIPSPHLLGCDWSDCRDARYGGWRFCKDHLSLARKDMKSDDYLQSVPWRGNNRTHEMAEDTDETKNGQDE